MILQRLASGENRSFPFFDPLRIATEFREKCPKKFTGIKKEIRLERRICKVERYMIQRKKRTKKLTENDHFSL